jgi:hypothetical protein
MKSKHHLYKNNYLSSSFLKYQFLNGINKSINLESKDKEERQSNLTPNKRFSELAKHKSNQSLVHFMESQNKKHISTKFEYKDVKNFLNEKDKAMKEIIIDENIIRNNDNAKGGNNKANNKRYDNSSSQSQKLIFHGTFGEDKYGQLMNEKHHHHNHHHHHHHHHHHSTENIVLIDGGNNNENLNINKNYF